MSAAPFVFFGLADLTGSQAVCVLVCLCVASASAVVCVARWMARDEDRARDEFWKSGDRWPVGSSHCEDPER